MTKRSYGWVKDSADQRDGWRLAAPAGSEPDVFPVFHDLSSNFPPVYNQLSTNSCTGQAIAAVFAYHLWKEDILPFDPSRLFIYYNERLIEGTTNEDEGAMIRNGFKAINKYGVCNENIWDFDINKVLAKPDQAAYDEAIKHIGVAYHRVPQTLHDFKSTLYDGIPIVCGIRVYESFESPEVASTGLVPMPRINEQEKGGHAIVIVGWNDESDTFICRNSWDETWGINGYFLIPQKYMIDPYLCSDIWCLTLVV